MKDFNTEKIGWWAYVVTFIVILAVCGWWLFYPYDPISVKYIKVLTPKVVAGETMTYEIKYSKNMDISGVLSRKLKNTFNIELADVSATAKVGPDTDKITIPIPRYADPGEYSLWWSASYQVNPLRKVTVNKESDKFQIVCNGPKGDTGPRGVHGDKGEKVDTGQKGGITFQISK